MSQVDSVRMKPAPGRRVRDLNNQVVPPEGADVPLLPAGKGLSIEDRLPSLWRRRFDDGDVEIERAKPSTKTKEA